MELRWPLPGAVSEACLTHRRDVPMHVPLGENFPRLPIGIIICWFKLTWKILSSLDLLSSIFQIVYTCDVVMSKKKKKTASDQGLRVSGLSYRKSVKLNVLKTFRLRICSVRAFSPKSNLLLLLSRFSRVWLCATPQTAAHQALLSLGFSRQEHWSQLPFPSPMHESEK